MTSTSAEKSADKGLAAQATKLVVASVGSVRAKTTGPLLFIARLVVYGLVLFVVAITALTLLVILTVTIVNQLLPCLLYTSPSPRDVEESRMTSSA